MKAFFFSLMLAFSPLLMAQNSPFEVILEPLEIPELGGVQSFAFGQDNGKWLIVGGRLDGLHRRQPWASFDIAGHNNQLIVIDPVTGQKWNQSLTELPQSLQEQLSSTNMEFYQEGNMLYCIGGYGYSQTEGDHTTFPMLTAIDVPSVIDAIIQAQPIAPYFRQLTDPAFQVTGGHLEKIGDHFYLLGGQKFIGRYNPMGPTHGPGFEQEYTDAVHIFERYDDGDSLSFRLIESYRDAEQLHRRDYNAVAQILPDGSQAITMFSGVFRTDADLPFLKSVTIDASAYRVDSGFEQYYNHYHCPVLPIYDANEQEMHTVFFGGIAQFYDDEGTLVQDDNVPFVNTIARVTRSANGQMAEYKMTTEMPALLGAGAEFLLLETLPKYENEVLDWTAFTEDTTHVGYIFGGINSSAPNIFFVNDGTQSTASPMLYKVYLVKDEMVSVHPINPQSISELKLELYPNPSVGQLNIRYTLPYASTVQLVIRDASGKMIDQVERRETVPGQKTWEYQLPSLQAGSVLFVRLSTPKEEITRKLIVER